MVSNSLFFIPPVKRLPTRQETWVQSLGQEDPLEKEMATHSSTLAWKIPWTEEPGRLQSMGSQRVGHDWETTLHFTSLLLFYICLLLFHIFFFILELTFSLYFFEKFQLLIYYFFMTPSLIIFWLWCLYQISTKISRY